MKTFFYIAFWVGIGLLCLSAICSLIMAFLKSPQEFIAASGVIGGFTALIAGVFYANCRK